MSPSQASTAPADQHAGSALEDAARLLVRCLEAEGVEYVFGIPGEEKVRLADALTGSSIRYVLVRHEQGASFMAEMYGRLTDRACVGQANYFTVRGGRPAEPGRGPGAHADPAPATQQIRGHVAFWHGVRVERVRDGSGDAARGSSLLGRIAARLRG